MSRRPQPPQISKRVAENQERVSHALGSSPDVVQRTIHIGPRGRVTVLLVAVEGLYDNSFVSEQVVAPLTECAKDPTFTRSNAFRRIGTKLISASDARE